MLSLRLPALTGFLAKDLTTRAWTVPMLRHSSSRSRSYFFIVGSINQENTYSVSTICIGVWLFTSSHETCLHPFLHPQCASLLTVLSYICLFPYRPVRRNFWNARHQSVQRHVLFTIFVPISFTLKSFVLCQSVLPSTHMKMLCRRRSYWYVKDQIYLGGEPGDTARAVSLPSVNVTSLPTQVLAKH